MTPEFKSFGKIPRDNPFNVTITEKIDGTNACIIVVGGEIVGVQSRKRLITPEADNFGFAKWVETNTEELRKLGDGYHYGEWAGPGIQKNHHDLPEKTLLLFNVHRWRDGRQERPDCCGVVDVLFEGVLSSDSVEQCLEDLKAKETDKYRPEGVVVYYHTFRKYTKHTIKSPNGKWCK
jgi:hypothetical protein